MYAISDLLCFLTHRVVRYRLSVVRSNLKLAFPDKSEAERKAIENKFYLHFCDTIVETLKALTISKKELTKRFVIRNPEMASQYYGDKRMIMLYAAHFGNWEWFITLPDFLKIQIVTFYQPQNNKLINHLTLCSRTRDGIIAVESAKGYRYVVSYAAKKESAVTLIIGDQCPHRNAQKYWVKDFFGVDTPFLVGTDRIAKKTNQVLIYPSFTSYRRGYYEVELKLIEDSPQNVESTQIIEKYAHLLEEDIRRIPELWLWTHRRWKLKHENYPNE